MPKPLWQKQEEADARKAARAQRTAEEQFDLIQKRPGNSSAEKEKLTRQGASAKPRRKAAKKKEGK